MAEAAEAICKGYIFSTIKCLYPKFQVANVLVYPTFLYDVTLYWLFFERLHIQHRHQRCLLSLHHSIIRPSTRDCQHSRIKFAATPAQKIDGERRTMNFNSWYGMLARFIQLASDEIFCQTERRGGEFGSGFGPRDCISRRYLSELIFVSGAIC